MANEEKHSQNRNKSLHARKESKGEVSVRSGDAQSSLSIRLFGPFEMLLGGRPLPRLTRRKSPAILAMLALRQGSETERDWLAGLLWPDSAQAAASHSLRNCLTELRRALGPEAARLRSPSF